MTYLRLLGVLRELYAQPRDMSRFKAYLRAAVGDGDDVELPILLANPMAKEHALAILDELLALGAEEAGEKAANEAAARLDGVPGALKLGLVLADDAQGGWTNRYTTDAAVRFETAAMVKRNLSQAVLWTSEPVSLERVCGAVREAIYRHAYQLRFGAPTTLREMLRQEGLTLTFAGRAPALSPVELAAAREVMTPHLDAPLMTAYPAAFAALYGDVGAEAVGYTPLGLPPNAGFEVAQADALAAGRDPVAALR